MSQTAFNRFGTRTRGDTSGWTDTPEIAAKRAAGLLTDSSTGARLTLAAPLTGGESSAPVSATLKAAMEQYGQHRQKSLLELHAERQAAGGSKGGSKGGSSKSEKQRKGDKDEKKKSKSETNDKDKDKKTDKDKKGTACLPWPS